jgi:hypothetical protein
VIADLAAWLVNGTRYFRENVVGVGTNQPNCANHKDEDHGKHDGVFSDVLGFIVYTELSEKRHNPPTGQKKPLRGNFRREVAAVKPKRTVVARFELTSLALGMSIEANPRFSFLQEAVDFFENSQQFGGVFFLRR